MDPIVEIVEAAEREVLAHTIESTRGLRAYLCLHGRETELGLGDEGAVRRGDFRVHGGRYGPAVGECAQAVSQPRGRDTRALSGP